MKGEQNAMNRVIDMRRSTKEPAPMKRKAVIVVEYEAHDYYDARTQENEIRRALAELQAEFDRIDIRFGDRRPRVAPRAAAPIRCWPRS